ncbi:MAG TPA: UDP-4-amino-4,6-dideoxy-N-acetyl-beta-L-altrosamine transaminase [Patescibacteria group bacterium]
MKKIPYGHQTINNADINQVIKILKSDWVTQGPTVEKFENAMAKYVGSKYAVAVSSGTAALHAACFATGIKNGDEVIVPSMSFAASANCVCYLGARPILCDVDYVSGNINVDQAKKLITKKTKAIIGVDFAGQPANWDKIKKLAQDYNLATIDDAAHSLGSLYKNKKIGSISDLTTFSFHPVKSITTGEGGMIVTSDKNFYERLKIFITHGITKDPAKLIKNDGGWYYEMQELGYNYRLTDFQAALGLSQLKKINKFIKRRRAIVKIYNDAFSKLENIEIPKETNDVYSAWHIYPLKIKVKDLKQKKEVYGSFHSKKIGVQVHYIPIHLQPYYKKTFGYKEGNFPNAEKFYLEEFSLPLFPNLTSNQIKHIIRTIKEIKL